MQLYEKKTFVALSRCVYMQLQIHVCLIYHERFCFAFAAAAEDASDK